MPGQTAASGNQLVARAPEKNACFAPFGFSPVSHRPLGSERDSRVSSVRCSSASSAYSGLPEAGLYRCLRTSWTATGVNSALSSKFGRRIDPGVLIEWRGRLACQRRKPVPPARASNGPGSNESNQFLLTTAIAALLLYGVFNMKLDWLPEALSTAFFVVLLVVGLLLAVANYLYKGVVIEARCPDCTTPLALARPVGRNSMVKMLDSSEPLIHLDGQINVAEFNCPRCGVRLAVNEDETRFERAGDFTGRQEGRSRARGFGTKAGAWGQGDERTTVVDIEADVRDSDQSM